MTSIHLAPAQRQDLLDHYRRCADPAVGQRAHILLLPADGRPWAAIGRLLDRLARPECRNFFRHRGCAKPAKRS